MRRSQITVGVLSVVAGLVAAVAMAAASSGAKTVYIGQDKEMGADGTVTVTRVYCTERFKRVKPSYRISGPRDSIRVIKALHRGLDADAQKQAWALVRVVKKCHAATHDYGACDWRADLQPFGVSALPYGSATGEVSVTAFSEVTFTVTAEARGGNEFRIIRRPDGTLERSCDWRGKGRCRADGTW